MTTMTTTSVMTVSRSTLGFPRISARVRILLWLLVVMAVALGAVAVTVRSITVVSLTNKPG